MYTNINVFDFLSLEVNFNSKFTSLHRGRAFEYSKIICHRKTAKNILKKSSTGMFHRFVNGVEDFFSSMEWYAEQ